MCLVNDQTGARHVVMFASKELAELEASNLTDADGNNPEVAEYEINKI